MRRPLAAVLLALALLAGAVACGGGETTTPEPEAVEGTSPETTTEEAGGGGESEGDPEAGKQVFASAGCAGCHTYGPAGSSGTTGPNLDESAPSYDEAKTQIENGGGGMPAYKDQLSEEEIANVAAFVSQDSG